MHYLDINIGRIASKYPFVLFLKGFELCCKYFRAPGLDVQGGEGGGGCSRYLSGQACAPGNLSERVLLSERVELLN